VDGLHIKMELVVGISFIRDCKENGPKGHLVCILVFEDQHDHLDYYCLLVVLDIVQRMQSGLGLRQSGDPDDQHLKQVIRSSNEDLQSTCKSPSHKMEPCRTRRSRRIKLKRV